MNKNGQAMLIGIVILIAAVIIFLGSMPAIQEVANNVRGCSYFNCHGYVDAKAGATAVCGSTNQSHNDGLRIDTLGCTMLDMSVPLLMLIVIIGIAVMLIRGRLGSEGDTYGGASGY